MVVRLLTLNAGFFGAAALPWDARDVLVVQGGAWDGAAERDVREFLSDGGDFGQFPGAVRALRADPATAGARVVLTTTVAPSPASTGWRSLPAESAAGAFVRRALATTHAALGVELFDAFGLTAMRHAEKADGVHYIKHKKGGSLAFDAATGTRSACDGVVGMAWERALLSALCGDEASSGP
jgi:hypothetical protein